VPNEPRLAALNRLVLGWHARAASSGLEPFREWALATLKSLLYSDGAIWGLLLNAELKITPRVTSVYAQGLPEGVLDNFETVHSMILDSTLEPGYVLRVCLADRIWHGHTHSALREHGKRHELTNTMSTRGADPNAPGEQFILLSRREPAQQFTRQDAAVFEILAPHLMQAYSTSRRLLLASLGGGGDPRLTTRTVAMVDRAGVVHDAHSSFQATLRGEWEDWDGHRVPEPLRQLLARRKDVPFRYKGSRIAAYVVPVGDLYMLVARPLHPIDALTEREIEVAKPYAMGKNFREVAEQVGVSPATVRSHIRNVFAKIDVRNKTELAAKLGN
jgi:DNA-binding CsgD family transcriptional regulator